MPTISEPLLFAPLFQERPWGGRRLEELFHKALPPGARVGESWEVADRPEAQSVVRNGALKGAGLHALWECRREEIFGSRSAHMGARFPLLIKLLDATETLSVQVHPPAAVARELHGEPKTETWVILAAQAGAALYAGLRVGTTREAFARAVKEGCCEPLLHRLPVRTGDCMFIPSGRLHAIGAGNVILEVQQNSDTTYRVFDWNRKGLDGKPRQLHLAESMRSICFDDFEPSLQRPRGELLVESPYFRLERWELREEREAMVPGDFALMMAVCGAVECAGLRMTPGELFLIPAALPDRLVRPVAPETALIRITIP